MSQELQRIEPDEPESSVVPYHPMPPPSLFGTADPVEVVARASRVAASLKEVIKAQGLISKISGKEYPRCEAWTLLGTMLGVFPVLVWTRPVEGGWEARVEARTRDGAIVGAAEAQCLKSERNWSNRDDFALRSMAQTRATAKALRMPLGFVMTLGGFSATPAEEMDFAETPKPANANVSRRTQQQPTPAQATEKTRAWFLGEMRKAFEDKVILQWGVDHTNPAYLLPHEHLEDWPLAHVPTSKAALEAKVRECAEFMGIEPKTPQEAPGASAKPPSTSAAPKQNASETATRSKEGQSEPDHHSAEWYNFPMPWGKKAGTILGKLEKNYLYGLWKNFTVETTYNGKPKKKETIATDRAFRVMLDMAGVHYKFDEPKGGDQDSNMGSDPTEGDYDDVAY